jgi:hypothetical protein
MSANRRATVLARQLLGSLIRKDWPAESMWIDRYDNRTNVSAVSSHISTK